MPKLRVHNFSVSIDGYGAGPSQDIDNPLGVDGLRLHEWVFETRAWNKRQGTEGGSEGLDDRFLEEGDAGIGATIMGRNMFGPIRGEWPDESWTGWWGDDPAVSPPGVRPHPPRARADHDARRHDVQLRDRRYRSGSPAGIRRLRMERT